MKPHGERKFIVFEKHLLSLFASCPICAGPAEARITKVIGGMVKINQWCADEKLCQFSQIWLSQPFVKGQMPCSNLLLLASILILDECLSIKDISFHFELTQKSKAYTTVQ